MQSTRSNLSTTKSSAYHGPNPPNSITSSTPLDPISSLNPNSNQNPDAPLENGISNEIAHSNSLVLNKSLSEFSDNFSMGIYTLSSGDLGNILVRHGFGLQKYFRSASQALEARDKELERMAKEINSVYMEKWEENEKKSIEFREGLIGLKEKAELLKLEHEQTKMELHRHQDESYRFRLENVNLAKELRESKEKENGLLEEIKNRQVQVEKAEIEIKRSKGELEKLKEEVENFKKEFCSSFMRKLKEMKEEMDETKRKMRENIEITLEAFKEHLKAAKGTQKSDSKEQMESHGKVESHGEGETYSEGKLHLEVFEEIARIEQIFKAVLSSSSLEDNGILGKELESFTTNISKEISELKEDFSELKAPKNAEPNKKGQKKNQRERADALTRELSARDKKIKDLQDQIKKEKNETRKIVKELSQTKEMKEKAEKWNEKTKKKIKEILKIFPAFQKYEISF